jgi:hypothetical protein
MNLRGGIQVGNNATNVNRDILYNNPFAKFTGLKMALAHQLPKLGFQKRI